MEPAKTKIIIQAQIFDVKEHFIKQWVKGYGDQAIFEESSLGWYIHLLGSHEALYCGETQPPFYRGDNIKITLEHD